MELGKQYVVNGWSKKGPWVELGMVRLELRMLLGLDLVRWLYKRYKNKVKS